MKKLLPAALLAVACALLLLGCGKPEAPAATAAPTPEVTAAPEPTPTPEPTPEPITAVVYVPAEDNRTVLPITTAISEDSGRALLTALVEAGTLPDVDYGKNLYIEAGAGTAKIRREKTVGRLVRVDLSKAFGDAMQAISSLKRERAVIQCLVNTFVTYYGADAMTLTIEATTLETKSGANYEHGMMTDMFVPRPDSELHEQTLTIKAAVTDDETGETTEAEETFPVQMGKRCTVGVKKAEIRCTVQELGGSSVAVETKKEMNLVEDGKIIGTWKQFFLREGVPVTVTDVKETKGKTVRYTLTLAQAEDPA